MIDSNYYEHHAFDSEIFEDIRSAGDKFNSLSHDFTFLGKGKLDHGLEAYFDLDIYLAKDVAGIEQYMGYIRSYPESDKEYDEIQLVLEQAYPGSEFHISWGPSPMATLIPLDKIEETPAGEYLVTPEIPIWKHKWVSVDANEHLTRLGGYPSFGEASAYGQPHGRNDEGEWKPLPFIAQYILPDGRFVHIYHVDDPEGYEGKNDDHLLGFSIDCPYRSLVLIQDSIIPDGFCLMPVENKERSIVSTKAVAVEGGKWPKSVNYIQGTETDEGYPYTLFHLPSSSGYGEDQDKMLTYAEAYIVWDGKNKAKLVEQYD